MKVNGTKVTPLKSGYYTVLEINTRPELDSQTRGFAFEVIIAERTLPIQYRKTDEGIRTFIDIVSRNNDQVYIEVGQFINLFSSEEQAEAFKEEGEIIISE